MKRAITRLAVIVLVSYRAAKAQVFGMALPRLTPGLPLQAADHKFTQIDFQPLLESKRRFGMKNKIRIASSIFAVVALLTFPLTSAFAQAVGNYVSFDVPNATLTRPWDVNNLGVIVGTFYDKNGIQHGFMLADGVVTSIDFPGAGATAALGINDSGQIVGWYANNGIPRGFLLSNGSFTTIEVPGAIQTFCHGINNNGDVVGRNLSPRNPAKGGGWGLVEEHGFLLHTNQFTSIDFPNAATTDAWKIADDGTIVGDWADNPGVSFGSLNSGSLHGYAFSQGQFFSFDFPGKLGTGSRKVNRSGWMVGGYIEREIVVHGFVQINGRFSAFDFPGAVSTDGNALNDAGMVVGSYTDSSGQEHGYAALATAQ
jgi:probable HAF family extracellular repeat protein